MSQFTRPTLLDKFGRPLRDLRLSLTDRCNFRCPYCMPLAAYGKGHRFLATSEVLTKEEMLRLVRAMIPLGLRKVRITGGEPLLREDLTEIIRGLKSIQEVEEVALTTNGYYLGCKAQALRGAGLDRINLSLDTLEPAKAARLNGLGLALEPVLEGIDAAARAGLPIKLNCLLQRGENEQEIPRLCAFARERGHTLRFIEYMDVGTTNGWKPEKVVPAKEVLDRIAAHWALVPLEPAFRGEVAARYAYADGAGEVGIIGSVTEPFCKDCHRARLSADGKLFTCLFAARGHDFKAVLRQGASDQTLSQRLGQIWSAREDRYSDERSEILGRGEKREKIEMSYIGG